MIRPVHSLASADAVGEEKAPTLRVFEKICDEIRTQLVAGRLKSGDKLPAEREFALQLGSSRTAVREAFRSLEIAGVIELRKGVKGGAFIREGDPSVVTRSFGDMVSLGRISFENLTESRVIIQNAVIRLACERAEDRDFEALELSIFRTEQLTREKRYDERRLQLLQFYRLLAQATRNEVMVIMVDAVTDIVLKLLARDGVAPRQDTVKAHREILRSLRQRDPEKAARLMSLHLHALHAHMQQTPPRGAAVASGRAGPARKTVVARAARA